MKAWIISILQGCLSVMHLSADGLAIEQKTVDVIQEAWNYFVLFAVGLTLVYFILEVNRRWAFEGADVNLKSFFSPFLKLVIAIVVISQAGTLYSYILDFNNTIIAHDWTATATPTPTPANSAATTTDDVKSDIAPAEDGTSAADTISKAVNSLGMVECVVMFIPTCVLWLVTCILSLIFTYKALMYKMELLIRLAITPIALGDVYSGQNSNAMRWTKGFLGLILYGACFSLIPLVANAVGIGSFSACDNIWELMKSMVLILAIPFAEIGMLNVARSATKEVMGA